MSETLFFVGEQPYQIRVVGDAVLVQCIRCERFSMVPKGMRLEQGDEGPTLIPAPEWPNEIVCGHAECRAPFVVWRGHGYAH